MYIVMGGTGHVGAAVAHTLLERDEGVGIITHVPAQATGWHERGAQILEADVNDADSLRRAFRRGRRAFLLNPPANPAGDTDRIERQTVAAILQALEDSGLEKVVAVSTAGAQAGERLGDLNVLWEFEQGLQRQRIPAAIQRGAYYMSNWDTQLDAARSSGHLQSMIPADMAIPMVCPRDLGAFAAQRLQSDVEDVALCHVEGPQRYSPMAVAEVFGQLLGRPVKVRITPPDQFKQAFEALGFSAAAAESYARMTALSIDQHFDIPETALKGSTTLQAHLSAALQASDSKVLDV